MLQRSKQRRKRNKLRGTREPETKEQIAKKIRFGSARRSMMMSQPDSASASPPPAKEKSGRIDAGQQKSSRNRSEDWGKEAEKMKIRELNSHFLIKTPPDWEIQSAELETCRDVWDLNSRI